MIFEPATGKIYLRYWAGADGSVEKTFKKERLTPGVEQRIELKGLKPHTLYHYEVYVSTRKVADGKFRTAPPRNEFSDSIKIAFGSCFHKIGLHNPNLINRIVERQPLAMMLLGDIAVDDRENHINMHRSDYLLRDVSAAWRQLAASLWHPPAAFVHLPSRV